LNWLGGIRLRH